MSWLLAILMLGGVISVPLPPPSAPPTFNFFNDPTVFCTTFINLRSGKQTLCVYSDTEESIWQ